MTTEQQVCWYCPCFEQLRQREWEDEFFVFNPASGDTHVLNGLAMEILRLLSLKPTPPRMLIAAIKTLTGDDENTQLDEALSLHIQHLDNMGLIIPTSCDPAATIQS